MADILLLEDDTEIRLGLEQHLRREGFSLVSVGTGRDALTVLNAPGTRLDAALLDLSLPDMDGLDVLRAIRTHPAHKALPVLLVTARSEEIDRVLGLELAPMTTSPSPSRPGSWPPGCAPSSGAPPRPNRPNRRPG